MGVDVSSEPVLVLLFGMSGCEYCEESLPHFRDVSAEHPGVPAYAVDCAAQQAAADFYRVEVTPTTLLLSRGAIVKRLEGAAGRRTYEKIFAEAEHLRGQQVAGALAQPFFRRR